MHQITPSTKYVILIYKKDGFPNFQSFGPSEVRATSGQHLGGHYFAYINLFLLLLFLPQLFKTTEGVVVGFQIFAWDPCSQKYEDSNDKKISGTPPTPLKRVILGEQKGRRPVFWPKAHFDVLKFCMGS